MVKSGGLTRAACGHWIFTWNAFRIECDPQTVIETLQSFDLDSVDVQDGTLYRESEAREPARLARKAASPDGATFVAELAVDPEAVRRERAQSDVVVAEIAHRQILGLDQALHARAEESIAGTITVTFETDALGSVRRRTKVTKIEIREPDGRSEAETITETLERKRISHSGS